MNELSETPFNPKAFQFPEIPLEEYRACAFQQWRPGEIAFIPYGVFCPSIHPSFGIDQPPFIEDCAAFLVIVLSAGKRNLAYAGGVPSILRGVVEGATIYFLVVFAGQLLFIFFELLAPVSDLSANSFSSPRLITATHRNHSHRSQQGKPPPSNISIKLNPTTCSPTHSVNIV